MEGGCKVEHRWWQGTGGRVRLRQGGRFGRKGNSVKLNNQRFIYFIFILL